jgi:hypothetical protein
MKIQFVVVDAENSISWSAKKEKGETFRSYVAAQKRAEEMASYEPGKPVGIYEKIGEAISEVRPVKTSRRK